jgi:hypothetical protein
MWGCFDSRPHWIKKRPAHCGASLCKRVSKKEEKKLSFSSVISTRDRTITRNKYTKYWLKKSQWIEGSFVIVAVNSGSLVGVD